MIIDGKYVPDPKNLTEGEIEPFRLPELGEKKKTNPLAIPKPTVSFVEEKEIRQKKPIWQKAEHIEKRFLKVLTIITCSFFSLSLLFSQTVSAQKSAKQYIADAQQDLSSSFDAIDEGDIGNAINELTKATAKIKRLKLILQSFGQDIKFLHYINKKSSEVSALERVLDCSYNVLNLFQITSDKASLLSGNMFTIDRSEYIFSLKNARHSILTLINDAENQLTNNKESIILVQDSLPGSFKNESNRIVSAISKFSTQVPTIRDLLTTDLAWLGGEDGKEKNIMLIFQNNAELRGGSGGSFGSFGIANFSGGNLKSIDFGTNIFKIDNEYVKKQCDQYDNELKFATDGCMRLKDSGWSVDGKEAMQTIQSMYKKETGRNVDGIITIDTSAFISLLKEIGPINMPDYGQIITSDNFRSVIENEVHDDYFQRGSNKDINEPKQILADMMPKFISMLTDSLHSSEKFVSISSSLSRAVKSKDILFYFNNDSFQKKNDQYNLSGAVMSSVSDYLYINSSNVNGYKSSLSIEENIDLEVNIGNDGNITDKVNLTRRHFGTNDFPDGLNRNYVRMLLPENSKLLSFNPMAGNFQRAYDHGYLNNQPFWITNDYGKTDLNFWMNTEAGKASAVEINYLSNYRVDPTGDFNYELTIQKQPGANPDEVNLKINYPIGFRPSNVKNYDLVNHRITLKLKLTSDKIIKIRFQKLK